MAELQDSVVDAQHTFAEKTERDVIAAAQQGDKLTKLLMQMRKAGLKSNI